MKHTPLTPLPIRPKQVAFGLLPVAQVPQMCQKVSQTGRFANTSLIPFFHPISDSKSSYLILTLLHAIANFFSRSDANRKKSQRRASYAAAEDFQLRSTGTMAQTASEKSGLERNASMSVLGVGMSSPSSSIPSRCSSIASFAMLSASANVLPAEKQPGRSGTVTP